MNRSGPPRRRGAKPFRQAEPGASPPRSARPVDGAGTVVAIVGLGYVGLPLAVAFGSKYRTIGYDLSETKVADDREGRDPTRQLSRARLRAADRLDFATDTTRIAQADFVIVAVPTPVDAARQPDFGPLRSASEVVGRHLKFGATVVFESTVYPGATEEVCIPVLESASGKRWKRDFFVGYSPERINPGDGEHTLERIVKVVAGDTRETLERVASLYGSVEPAGVHRASSIRVAEAAKVIENTQRDLNIAFVNELAILFHRLGLDRKEVLDTAATKWNFLPFRPGLVGGHCIDVDPYYLTHEAERVGHHPEVILAGRRINDGMSGYVAGEAIKLIAQPGRPVRGAQVNVLGLTFKEDCPDLRNSRVVDVVRGLEGYGAQVNLHDPIADPDDARREYGRPPSGFDDLPAAAAVIVTVAHRDYRERSLAAILSWIEPGGCLIDVKSLFDPASVRAAGALHWRL